MDYHEQLLPCVRQQTVLLTRISDITAQIEVRSRQADIQLDDLPEQRQIFIDRLKKCNGLIAKTTAKLPETEQERLHKILRGTFSEENCRAEEQELLQCGIKNSNLLQNILAVDSEARGRISRECARLQKHLRSTNRSGRYS